MSQAQMAQKSLSATIRDILELELQPQHLEVIDESHGHSRRTANNPETHIKVIVVSSAFAGLNRVKRQQLVYSFLKTLFTQGLHALSQATYTPAEWALNPDVNRSPGCAGKPKSRES